MGFTSKVNNKVKITNKITPYMNLHLTMKAVPFAYLTDSFNMVFMISIMLPFREQEKTNLAN